MDAPPDWSTLYHRLLWLQKARDVPQREFAAEAGVGESTLGVFFSRGAKEPEKTTITAANLAAIARRWKASPAWLLLGVGHPDDQAASTSAPSSPRFCNCIDWQNSVRSVADGESPPPRWAIDAVGLWPAPPPEVPVSPALVRALARVMVDYYPARTVHQPRAFSPDAPALAEPTRSRTGTDDE